jgi:hypothetical protein
LLVAILGIDEVFERLAPRRGSYVACPDFLCRKRSRVRRRRNRISCSVPREGQARDETRRIPPLFTWREECGTRRKERDRESSKKSEQGTLKHTSMLPVRSFWTTLKAAEPNRSRRVQSTSALRSVSLWITRLRENGRTKELDEALGGEQEGESIDAVVGDGNVGVRLREKGRGFGQKVPQRLLPMRTYL